jgi:uncharacterized protein
VSTTFSRQITVPGDTQVSSVWSVPPNYEAVNGAALILAHGAGNDMNNPLLTAVHTELAQRGLLTIRFNFPYKERGRKLPDRAPVLEATWRAVIAAVRDDLKLSPKRMFFGGKSMGGRIVSQVVAAGMHCNGLVFLGYPLHPANRPEKLRARHLKMIRCPMLFIQGTRDALCNLDLLKGSANELQVPVRLHVIEGGDHSFNVLKGLGRSQSDVQHEIIQAVGDWLATNSES